jgi:hypothetical protein
MVQCATVHTSNSAATKSAELNTALKVDQFEVCCIVSCQVNLLLQSVVSTRTTRVQLLKKK